MILDPRTRIFCMSTLLNMDMFVRVRFQHQSILVQYRDFLQDDKITVLIIGYDCSSLQILPRERNA
jgi:hypothetical protein